MNFTLDAQLLAALGAPLAALYAVRRAYAFELGAASATVSPDARVIAAIAALITLSALSAASPLAAAANVAFLCGLAHIALIDWRLMVTPVRLPLVLAAFGIGCAYWQGGAAQAGLCAVSGAVGWASFRLLDRLYLALRGRSGLGEGDALIAAALGGWLSIDGLVWSVALGGAFSLLIARLLRRENGALPLAPGLALGAFVVLMVKQWV